MWVSLCLIREVAVRQPKKYLESIDELDRLVAGDGERKPETLYKRFADLQIAGDGGESTLVELKSYRVGNSYVEDATKKVTLLPSKALVAKTPLWNVNEKWIKVKVKNKKTGKYEEKIVRPKTTMHRQILLDAISIREQLNEENRRSDPQAEDFIWYFQSWKQQFEGKKTQRKLNESVGVSLADIKVTHRSKEYDGMEFVARRLSPLSGHVTRGKVPAEWMAFNLGLPEKSLKYKETGYSDRLTLYTDTGSQDSWLPSLLVGGEGGLKKRIRKFGLFGDVTPAEQSTLIQEAFGLDPESDFVKLLLGEETLDWVEEAKDHIEKFEDAIDELADSVIDKDQFEAYTEQLDEFEEKIGEMREDLVESAAKSLPKEPESEKKCE